jgi:hypothetical protein
MSGSRTVFTASSIASSRCSAVSSRPSGPSADSLGHEDFSLSAACAAALLSSSKLARWASVGCTFCSMRSNGKCTRLAASPPHNCAKRRLQTAMRWPTPGRIRGRSRRTWGTAASSTRCATPNSHRNDLNDFGGTKLLNKGLRGSQEFLEAIGSFAVGRAASARHRCRSMAPRSSLSGLARPPGCHSRSMPTCCGTRPGMPLRGAALIPGRCRPSWDTGRSPIRSSTRQLQISASDISGIARSKADPIASHCLAESRPTAPLEESPLALPRGKTFEPDPRRAVAWPPIDRSSVLVQLQTPRETKRLLPTLGFLSLMNGCP